MRAAPGWSSAASDTDGAHDQAPRRRRTALALGDRTPGSGPIGRAPHDRHTADGPLHDRAAGYDPHPGRAASDEGTTRVYSILLGGANNALEIRSNTVRGTTTATGMRFAPEQFTLYPLPVPSNNVLVTDNDIRGAAAGIYVRPASLVASLIADNTTSENRGNGINMFSSGNVIRANQSNDNGVAGITAFPGATGNLFEHNSMHGNAPVPGASYPPADARDIDAWLTGTFQNEIGNDCDTDLPTGRICGVG